MPISVLRGRLASGATRAVEVAEATIARVEARNDEVSAFAWFDADFARRQAAGIDAYRGRGGSLGPLHGLPVAIDDTIDTARIPTEAGFAPYKGHVPEHDSAIAERLRAAGALIAGKTATGELGIGTPRGSRRENDKGAGGFTEGAAIAVAEGMVPLAVGMGSDGAVVRSAAYGGVTGFTPSFGSISRRGVLDLAPSIDAPGVFAPTVTGVALLAEVLFGHDAADRASGPAAPHPRLLDHACSTPPVRPTLAFVRTPWWDRADDDMQAAFGELVSVLGESCFEAELPDIFADSAIFAERVALAETAKCLFGVRERHPEGLSEALTHALDRGEAISARDYLSAHDWRSVLYAGLEAVLSRCDAIITLAAIGPVGRGTTMEGETLFNTLWTFLGVPSVSLPLLQAADGSPMGVQLVGRRGEDGRLLRTARWLETHLSNGEELG